MAILKLMAAVKISRQTEYVGINRGPEDWPVRCGEAATRARSCKSEVTNLSLLIRWAPPTTCVKSNGRDSDPFIRFFGISECGLAILP
jgi:hypothetical protein